MNSLVVGLDVDHRIDNIPSLTNLNSLILSTADTV